MNLHWLWSITALTAELCEVATYLEDDSAYTKQDAAEQLREIIERHMYPLFDKSMQSE